VNLYGRAVGANEKVPKADRHDHLPGSKGYFNAPAMRHGEGPLFVCEGAFDALSLLTAGYKRVVAIFGVEGWRWEWAKDIKQLVFAMDADKAGQTAWRELAKQAVLRGKEVSYLTPEDYGGYKDVNEAWVAGVLDVGEWPAAEEVAAADEEEPAPQQWALVDSEVLGEKVVFAADEQAATQAPAGYVAYTAAELERLEGLTPEGLQCVHKAKRCFSGIVKEVTA
jgi:hypothetical protein